MSKIVSGRVARVGIWGARATLAGVVEDSWNIQSRRGGGCKRQGGKMGGWEEKFGVRREASLWISFSMNSQGQGARSVQPSQGAAIDKQTESEASPRTPNCPRLLCVFGRPGRFTETKQAEPPRQGVPR